MHQIRDAIVPVGTAPIGAWIHDGKKALAWVSTNRFVVLNVEPGVHRFSASESKKWSPRQTVELNVVTGATYCLRTSARYVTVPVERAGYAWGQLAVVPCNDAGKDLAEAIPAEARSIDKEQTKNVDACMAPPPPSGKKTRLSDPQPVADPAACLALLH